MKNTILIFQAQIIACNGGHIEEKAQMIRNNIYMAFQYIQLILNKPFNENNNINKTMSSPGFNGFYLIKLLVILVAGLLMSSASVLYILKGNCRPKSSSLSIYQEPNCEQ